jgi:hypothetical protein
MTNTRVCGNFIERKKGRRCEVLKYSMTGVTKTPMPQGGVRGGDCESTWRGGEWIEIPRATAPENHDPCPEILHRKTPRVKFNRAKIVSGKLTHKNEILDNTESNEDITESERARRIWSRNEGMSRVSNGDRRTVTDRNMSMTRRGERGEVTGVRGHVSRRSSVHVVVGGSLESHVVEEVGEGGRVQGWC